jgi:hypothetical protein
LGQGVQTVVLPLVVQFVQQFHADDFTVAPLRAELLRPFQAMGLQQDPSAVDVVGIERGPNAEVGHAGHGVTGRVARRLAVQAMHQHREDAAGRRFPVGKTQVHGLEAQLPAKLAAMNHVPADAVGASQQRGHAVHVAAGEGVAHQRTGDPVAVHLVAVHARDVETLGGAGGVEHGVVARPLGAEAEIVADQHVLRTQPAHQHVVDEGFGNLRRQPGIE